MLLPLLAAFALHAFGECKECKRDDLCASHQEADAKALEAARGKIRSKDVAEREAAVEAAAALTAAHANAPSRAVVDTLEIALADKDYALRSKVVAKLMDGQHADATVKALVAALRELRGEFAKVGQDSGGSRRDDRAEILTRDGTRYVSDLIGALGKLRDDRSVDALADVLKQLGPDAPNEFAQPVALALIELGSRSAIDAVIDRMVAAEGTRNGSRNGGAGGGGGGGGGGRGGGGGGRGGGGGGGGRGNQSGDRPADEGQRRAIHDGLSKVATEKSLGEAPPFDDQVAQSWRDWFDKYGTKLPARLGKQDSTPITPTGN